jgi:hypothetical protein
MTMPADLTYQDAVDMAFRFGCLLPRFHEDSPLAALWIAKVADLPLAMRQGRLAAAVIEANRFAGP